MTKPEVKLLCETDPHLQWWAMVLFAEICDVVHFGYARTDPDLLVRMVTAKVGEFPGLVVQRAMEKAKGKTSPATEEPGAPASSNISG